MTALLSVIRHVNPIAIRTASQTAHLDALQVAIRAAILLASLIALQAVAHHALRVLLVNAAGPIIVRRSTMKNRELESAAKRLSLEIEDRPLLGWAARTVGCRVTDEAGSEAWLRVVSEGQEWTHLPFWRGNEAANQIDGVPKPRFLRATEWIENGRSYRAELLEYVPSSPLSLSMMPPPKLDLGEDWWDLLKSSLERVGAIQTERMHTSPEHVARDLMVFFGLDTKDLEVRWQTIHGDLHWANLCGPELCVLDWESWGVGLAGYDVALLKTVSLDHEIVGFIDDFFRDELESESGLVSQLLVTIRMMKFFKKNELMNLAPSAHENARRVVKKLQMMLQAKRYSR